ncbi:cellulose biosynthesis protein BcsD [Burkholderia ubonensis]|uniref:cellulose biosynthesis protein BcsD n=1 Tax=Burkholderia ubonensis TaxID=101571 RepID=UPI0007546050|nr:cellulose biosynthesis protein BcsD [Burkholderia ubonensis]KWN65867.1 cellulose synthase [Burkholderia ubonensis]
MPTVLDALHDQHLSPQWLGLLRALAAEFESQLSHAELRQLMARVGQRFAADHPVPACASLPDLVEHLNAQWAAIQWGGVALTDERDFVRITHYGAPLRSFGTQAHAWAAAFLQGCYQTWFDAAGATGLSVVAGDPPQDHLAVEFRLTRVAA